VRLKVSVNPHLSRKDILTLARRFNAGSQAGIVAKSRRDDRYMNARIAPCPGSSLKSPLEIGGSRPSRIDEAFEHQRSKGYLCVPGRISARFGIHFNAGEDSVRQREPLVLWQEQRFGRDAVERLHGNRIVARTLVYKQWKSR
jgi:hypothetical protein